MKDFGRISLAAAAILLAFVLIEMSLRFTPLRCLVPFDYGISGSVPYRVQPSWFVNDAESWSFASNIQTTTEAPDRKPIRIRTNSLGFRGAEIEPRRTGEYRIAMVGDSYTASLQVDEDKSFPAILEARLNQSALPETSFRIMNVGIPAFDLVREWGLLRALSDRLDPDLILVQISIVNDILYYRSFYPLEPKTPPARLSYWLRSHSYAYFTLSRGLSKLSNYLKERAMTRKTSSNGAQLLHHQRSIIQKYHQGPVSDRLVEAFVKDAELERFILSWNPRAPVYFATIWMMEEIKSLADRRRVPAIFYLIPMTCQVESKDRNQFVEILGKSPADLWRPQKTLRALAEHQGLQVLDPSSALAAASRTGRIFFEIDEHLNDHGSACLGQFLWQAIWKFPPISQRLNAARPPAGSRVAAGALPASR